MLLVVLLVVSIYYSIINEKQRIATLKAAIAQRYNSLENFETSKKIERNLCFIFAIDEKNSKVAYIDANQVKIIPFEQIYKVEYIENSSVVASKSSIRTVGGALVGGVLAGGAGAIVGGLSGDTKMNNLITLMQVKIGLRDINSPALTINIYEDDKVFNPSVSNVFYKHEMEYINNIVDSLSVIIDKVDKEKNVQTASTTHLSVADELNKLVQLKEAGVLTEQEFEQQKQKILNE